MKKIVVVSAIASASICPALYAQDSLVGKYSGNYTVKTSKGDNQNGIELTIASVQDGVVKGTTTRQGRGCRGEYPVEGTYKDNQLVLESGKGGGAAGDCSTQLRLTAEGDKLKGTVQQYPVELSKN